MQFALLTVGLMAFRTNGAAIALLLAVIAGIQYRNKKIVVAFLAAILIVTIPGRILLSTVHKQPQFQEAVAIPLQQMSRVYVLKGYSGTFVKTKIDEFLNVSGSRHCSIEQQCREVALCWRDVPDG